VERVGDWLEGQIDAGGGKAWKPGGWKRGLGDWLKRSAERAGTKPGPSRDQVDPRPILQRVAQGDLQWRQRWHDDGDTDRRLHACAKGLLPGLKGDQWQHRAAMQTAMERWESST